MTIRHPEKISNPINLIKKKPTWIRTKILDTQNYFKTKEIINRKKLHTVCQEASCPNISECWSKRHATFMIMGDTCTRACAFCDVKTGKPKHLDPMEPLKIAQATRELNLKHVVITSVDRDDLNDGGANHFSKVILETKRINTNTTIEVLTPDFLRKGDAYKKVIEAKPDVFNHNIETVPGLYRKVRPGSRYFASVELLKNAKKIDKISYEEMLEMSSMGAKVLHTRSVELAMKNNLTLQVLSSLTNQEGTFIVNEKKLIEKEVVSGVSYSKNESKITISGIPDKPGIAAIIFRILSRNNINIDMIVQNISQDGISANLTFTVLNKDMKISKNLLEKNSEKILYKQLSTNSEVAKISVIGMGMMSQSGVAEKMFQTLADQQINILAISTSEIKISVLIEEKYTNNAVNSLHSAYRLGINN